MPISDAQMNAVLTKIADNIPSDCATYDNVRKKSLNTVSSLNAKTFEVSDYEAYRNDIEFVNSFNEQVLIDERNYFTKKYSPEVYAFLLAQRTKYIEKKKEISEKAACGLCPFDQSKCSNVVDVKIIQANALQAKKCKESTDFLGYLLKQLPLEKPETTYKKVEYRDEAHEFLSTMNKLLTVFYFVLLFVMLFLLSATQRLMLRERFMLYLFLVVLPFAFPYLFSFLKYLYFRMFPQEETHGPKNAFLENQDTPIGSFNV
jgi:hypothetical protein